MDPRSVKEELFEDLISPKEKIEFLLNYAVLAPSTHNSQPWLFEIQKNSCKILINPKINITQADPKGRDLYISLGCCIENFITAAQYFNVYKKISYAPKNKKNLVAEIHFVNLSKLNIKKNAKLQPMIEAVKKRITVRGVFQQKKIPETVIKNIKNDQDFKKLTLHVVTNKEQIVDLSKLTAEGLRIAYKSKQFRKEMYKWFVNNFSKRREGLPGYSLKMPTVLSVIFPFMVRFFNIGNLVSKLNYRSMSSMPLVCVISAKESNPATWLQVGRLAERTMLKLHSKNIKTSIFVASVEMGNLYKQVQKVLRTQDRPQFLFCAGYMDTNQPYTLRHEVNKKIV